MKIIRYSSKYKKDIKRYANQPNKLNALFNILRLLSEGKPIPAEHQSVPRIFCTQNLQRKRNVRIFAKESIM